MSTISERPVEQRRAVLKTAGILWTVVFAVFTGFILMTAMD